MLLGEDSRIRDYWRKLGQDALRHGVKGVIIMVRQTYSLTFLLSDFLRKLSIGSPLELGRREGQDRDRSFTGIHASYQHPS
jgi:hypothetical protein